MASTSQPFPPAGVPRSASERDQLLDDVVVAYLEAVESGQPPNAQAWLARYPELATELAEFFADQAKVNGWTKPLREASPKAETAVEDPCQTTLHAASPVAAFPVVGGLRDYELLDEIARGAMGSWPRRPTCSASAPRRRPPPTSTIRTSCRSMK